MEQTIHVRVGKVAKELALGAGSTCSAAGGSRRRSARAQSGRATLGRARCLQLVQPVLWLAQHF
jgi:hypothetical protein